MKDLILLVIVGAVFTNLCQAFHLIPVRLRGGRNAKRGRVEALVGLQWGTICSEGWDLREATVVCKQLGYGYAREAYSGDVFRGLRRTKLLSGTVCTGYEDSLGDCFYNQTRPVLCPNANFIAGVVCGGRLPDLVLDAEDIERSASFEKRTMSQLVCALEDRCLSSSADDIPERNYNTQERKLLRFSNTAWNEGTKDFRPFVPPSQWIWHSCHGHYHSMESYARYDIVTEDGELVAEGHKASFCLMDTGCRSGYRGSYTCSAYNQGISVGCSDTYGASLDCQWIDITDVPRGQYLLQIHLNADFEVAEMNYKNNQVQCELEIKRNDAIVEGCRYPLLEDK